MRTSGLPCSLNSITFPVQSEYLGICNVFTTHISAKWFSCEMVFKCFVHWSCSSLQLGHCQKRILAGSSKGLANRTEMIQFGCFFLSTSFSLAVSKGLKSLYDITETCIITWSCLHCEHAFLPQGRCCLEPWGRAGCLCTGTEVLLCLNVILLLQCWINSSFWAICFTSPGRH